MSNPSFSSVFHQDAEPTPRKIGDRWITDDGVVKTAYRVTPTALWHTDTAVDVGNAAALADGKVWIGDGDDVAQAITPTGDATITNLGVVALAAGAATPAKTGIAVINKTGSTIATDKLVAISSLDATAGKPKIVLADADVAAHEDVWVTAAAILNNAEGVVYKGALSAADLNTDGASAAGDPVYLDTTAGGFTVTAPTTAISRVHPVGMVVVKHASTGQIRWSIGPARKIGTNEVQDSTVTAVKITDAILTGAKAAVVADINVIGGIPVVHRIVVTALTGDQDLTLTHKTRVIDVWAVQKGGAGGAGDTIVVKNVAAAISSVLDMNIADTIMARTLSIDDANHEVAAGAALRVTGASAVTADVYVLGLRVA